MRELGLIKYSRVRLVFFAGKKSAISKIEQRDYVQVSG